MMKYFRAFVWFLAASLVVAILVVGIVEDPNILTLEGFADAMSRGSGLRKD